MNKKITRIVCPKCGTQYLPGEIYLPKSFLGQPKEVVRDYRGKILEYSGESMDTKETYICDNCDTKFSVRAVVQFYTEAKEENNVSSQFKLKISNGHKPKLILSEL